jgi:Lysylphosphatidylglycerol synthase TM region
MTAHQDADTPPDARVGRASPQHGGRRRRAVRWIANGVLFVALAVGVFGVLPRLGGLRHEAAGLRHARPAFLAAAIVAQATSLGCYAQLYRQVLAALGARLRFRLAAHVILASFFVSHLTPFGSATGTLVNVSTLEAEGIAAATTGEAIALTSLTSTVALIALFATGFTATAGRHVSQQYLMIAGIALFLVAVVTGRRARRGRPSRRRRAGRALGRPHGAAFPAGHRSGPGRRDQHPARVAGRVVILGLHRSNDITLSDGAARGNAGSPAAMRGQCSLRRSSTKGAQIRSIWRASEHVRAPGDGLPW